MSPQPVTFLTATEGWGGTELHTLAVVSHLVARGHPVRIMQLGHQVYSQHLLSHGAGSRHLEELPPGRHLDGPAWRRLLGGEAGILVHVKGGFRLSWPLMDRTVLASGRRLLRIEHAVPRRRSWRQRISPRALMRARWHRQAAHHVLTVANAVRDAMVGSYGYDRAHIEVITNGVDPARFRFDAVGRNAERTGWGMTDDDFVFGTVARLAPIKRIDRMLRAFAAQGPRQGKQPRLVIAGEGPDEGALRQLAGSLGIGGRCLFLGGTDRVAEVLSGLDAFLLTSATESASYALLEAMSVERVVVAMAVDGVPELMRDGAFGRLTSASEAEFSAAMAEVRDWPAERRAASGSAARDHVTTHHDGDRQATRVAAWILGQAG